MAEPVRLGLTGGIGSGKSTVATLLAQLGAALIDADAISRNTTAPGGSAIAPIAEAFGPGFIGADGTLNRDRLRDLVYADTGARKRLEAIVHPLVGQEITRQTGVALLAGKTCIVFDIPLLVESSRWRHNLHQVLVVDCRPETQIERVMARSGLTREAVGKIIATQASRTMRLHAADFVLHNDQISLAQLRSEIAQLAGQIGLSSC